MNTKEAIENIKDIYDCHSNDRACNDGERERIENEKNEIVDLLQQSEKYKEKINILMSRENPYPEDIFTPIPKEDFAKINDLLKKELGYPIDRLSGHIGRELYKSFIETFKDK